MDQRTLAVVGVSRSEKKFSYRLFKSLKAKGYRLFAVNPNRVYVFDELETEQIKKETR